MWQARRHWRRLAVSFILAAAAGVTGAVVAAAPAPADTGASCTAALAVGWQTPSNSPPDFGATVTVTNNSSYTIESWTVTWTFSAGQAIVAGSPYSSAVTQAGTSVTATPDGTYNAVLSPGQSTTFGFDADYDGTSNPVPALSCAGPSQGAGSATLSGPLDPLGVNTASWDSGFTDPAIASSLSSASTGLIRYPGGSYADDYLWQPNTYQGTTDPVDFAQYSSQVDAITGGQKFVTVNYGSDTPADAAAWVTQSKTSGEGVSLWEVGNEEYGSWETDNHADPHTAASYASNGLSYLQAIKAADPDAQTCYDYAMDGDLAPGSGVDGYQDWNDTILSADGADINCADVHWYPVNGTPTESVQSIMALVDNIPAAAAEVHTALSSYDPSAYFVVGETNISQTANEWNEEPVGALFAAANSLEWLSFGAQSVDWWDVHNDGTPTADFGMFSSGSSGEPAADTPYPPYYGYALAAKLAVKGATVGTLAVPEASVYGYYSQQPGGGYSVMLVNADPATAYTMDAASLGLAGSAATVYTYSAASPAIATAALSGGSVQVPAESIVVLSGSGSPPSSIPTQAPSQSQTPTQAPTSPATPTQTPTPTSTPTSTATPTSTPTPTPPPAGTGGCQASWTVSNSWPGGFQLGFTVTSTASAATSSWTVGYSWPGSQAISQIWNASESQSGAAVSVSNLSYNGALTAGGSVTFGLTGTGTAPDSLPGLTCTAT